MYCPYIVFEIVSKADVLINCVMRINNFIFGTDVITIRTKQIVCKYSSVMSS